MSGKEIVEFQKCLGLSGESFGLGVQGLKLEGFEFRVTGLIGSWQVLIKSL